MGLTIYYRYKAKLVADGARALVERLHRFAQTLPFDDVSPILEFDSPDGRYVFERADDHPELRRWKPGTLYLDRKRADGEIENVEVPPLHVVYFAANLKGSETATFGLASHPPVVVHREEVITDLSDGSTEHRIGAGDPIEFPTRLRGWYSWSNFTKTQYAGNPRYGGPENFVRAHLSVFRMIGEAKRLGLKTRIRDDAKYWRHRNEVKLLAELAKWDRLIAGFTGRLSDKLGNAPGIIDAPIKDRPDFEHLEAESADEFRKLRAAARKKKRTK
jgi:hypothetical protein